MLNTTTKNATNEITRVMVLFLISADDISEIPTAICAIFEDK